MERKYNDILKKDVVVPEIVQKKADEAYIQIKERGTEDMIKKNVILRKEESQRKKATIKTLTAACACIALFIVAGNFLDIDISNENYETFEGETHVEIVKDDNLMQAIEKMFTLKAYAADHPEADENGYVTLNAGNNILV